MSSPDYTGLSDQLRLYFASLSPEVQDRFLTVIQQTFQVKNRRNAQLWVTEGQTRRNFVNRSVSPLELEMRVAFVRGLINDVPPTTVQKTVDFGINTNRVAFKLRQYLSDDFTRNAVTTIGFLIGETLYIYDADSSAFEDLDDDASDEFANIPTDPE